MGDGFHLHSRLCTSTASPENIWNSHALLGLSDQRKRLVSWGGSGGLGLGEPYFSSVGVQDSAGLSLKVLAGNCCPPGSPPMSQSQLLNHRLWLVPLGKGRPGIQEATCPVHVRWPLQPPPANTQPCLWFPVSLHSPGRGGVANLCCVVEAGSKTVGRPEI